MSPDRSLPPHRPDETRSLRSILSLAAGAAALQTANPSDAAIYTTDLGTQVVGFGSGEAHSAGFDLLPGISAKRIVFETNTNIGKSFVIRARFSNTTNSNDRLGIQSSGRSQQTYPGGQIVAFRTGYGPSWNALPRTYADTVADIVQAAKYRTATITNHTPGGGTTFVYNSAFKGVGPGAFTGKYLLFTFMNTDVGKVNYGWIHVAAATRTFTSPNVPPAMSVTFDAWGYQDDGSPIRAGQVAVPEPSTAASLAMAGALVTGAAGLRAWRRRR